jgi:hypothetical protein
LFLENVLWQKREKKVLVGNVGVPDLEAEECAKQPEWNGNLGNANASRTNTTNNTE